MVVGLDRFRKLILIPLVGPSLVITDESVDIGFTVDGSYKKDPDTATIKVFNANAATRKYIELNCVRVMLFAGRIFPPQQIFSGEIVNAYSHRSDDMTDFITEIEAEDTNEAFKVTPLPVSFAAGATISAVLAAICASTGMIPDLLFTDRAILSPVAFLSPGRKAVQSICRQFGLRYQISKGVCSVRDAGVPMNLVDVPVISKDTGLIGVPMTRKENKKVKISFTHMLEGRLIAGGLCKLVTTSISGKGIGDILFIERHTHTDDSEDLFTTECECRVYP